MSRKRVTVDRERQRRRFKGRKIYAKAQIGPRDITRHCHILAGAETLLEMAVTKLGFSIPELFG
jgi:predicted ATPase with chaperone activity